MHRLLDEVANLKLRAMLQKNNSPAWQKMALNQNWDCS
jgi:hypothetical protein